jgi:predicted RNA-binding protein YlqC (UPF0109 family)
MSESINLERSYPDYGELVRFLIEPLLDTPDALRIHCEYVRGNLGVLVRVAFEEADHGRVFGRGGRNIEAIRTVLAATAQNAGQTARLEVFGKPPEPVSQTDSRPAGRSRRRSSNRSTPKPSLPRPSRPRRNG